MKVLSLLQPWASLVVMGVKTIETRSWQTAYRGPLLIHASLSKKGGFLATEAPLSRYIPAFAHLPFGAIIGSVVLEEIVPIEHLSLSDRELHTLTLEEKAFGEYKDRYAWILVEPKQLEQPVFLKGSLGLWEYAMEDGRIPP